MTRHDSFIYILARSESRNKPVLQFNNSAWPQGLLCQLVCGSFIKHKRIYEHATCKSLIKDPKKNLKSPDN